MQFKLTCKACHRNIQIEGELQTKRIDCPNCGFRIDLPSNILDINEVIGGFKIEKHLGHGAMGCVYLATQMSMDRKVALKVLPPEMMEDQEEIDRFMHEVRMLAMLDHPNIVTAFEAGEDNNNYFMAMTYVDGETLEEHINHVGPMEEDDVLNIMIKVCEALA